VLQTCLYGYPETDDDDGDDDDDNNNNNNNNNNVQFLQGFTCFSFMDEISVSVLLFQ
jgi:hypothetical protein